jgi:hypothetical protein
MQTTIASSPNMRLKLAAPVLTGDGLRPAARCDRIPFVNSLSLRRSLGAIR